MTKLSAEEIYKNANKIICDNAAKGKPLLEGVDENEYNAAKAELSEKAKDKKCLVETPKQYHDFLESLLIEELIKEFNFNCKLTYTGKKRFGGSKITTYYFVDDMGITWQRDVSDRAWSSIAYRHPNCRPRITK